MKQILSLNKTLKQFYILVFLVIGIVVALQLLPFSISDRTSYTPIMTREISSIKEPIQPIPLHLELNKKKVALGEKLFNETKLSRNNSVSCVSCHDLKTGGTDRLIRSVGIDKIEGFVNTPTVFNSAFNFRQFWDGRAETLEEQIEGPTISAHEMGSNWPDVIRKLKQDLLYVSAFRTLYGDGITRENIKNAMAEYIRSLYTPNSRFDRYLRGDRNAITAAEKKGYTLFKEYGCVSCHQGINVGGNMFQKFGVLGNYFADRGQLTQADQGLANITGNSEDGQVFKVPSLRNVERTPPYFHDGSAKTLEQAVTIMAKYQLGKTLSIEEVELIVQFLKTLTGEYNGEPL